MKYRIVNRKKMIATAIADIAGSIFFGIPFLLKRNAKIEESKVKRILVIRTAYVGDVVMTLPMLKPLKDKFPSASISFLTSDNAAHLLEGHPCVDEVIAHNPFWFYNSSRADYRSFISDLKKREFDMIIEARGDIREFLFLLRPLKAKYKVSYSVGGGYYFLTHVVPHPSRNHRVKYHLDIAEHLGCDVSKLEWGLGCGDDEKARVEDLLTEENVKGSFVAAHPGSRIPLKRLSPEKYASLYDLIIDKHDLPIVIIGSAEEKVFAEEIKSKMKRKPIVLAGELKLREVVGLLDKAALFVCNDSAPMHIASAVNTPTVAVFGPSKSAETGPYGNQNRVVEKDYPCRYTCDESICRYSEYWGCMKSISVDDVLNSVEDLGRECSLF